MPESVVTIGDMAFQGCSDLSYVGIPASVESIGKLMFDECRELRWIYVDPENTEYCSEDGILYDKDKTTLIWCPAHYRQSSVTVPCSVERINDRAFCYCSELRYISIPASVESIGCLGFDECRWLREIYVDPENTAYCSEDGILYDKDKTMLIRCPSSCVMRSVYVPQSVMYIGDCAFAGCTGLKDIFMPDSVVSIHGEAFRDCKGLKSLSLPRSLKMCDHSAFEGCDSLETVYNYSGFDLDGDWSGFSEGVKVINCRDRTAL